MRAQSHDVLATGGGYLPSLASSSRVHRLGSDRIGLAFAGAVVAGALRRRDRLAGVAHRDVDVRAGANTSAATDSACTTLPVGTLRPSGTPDELPGYMSWAACLPEDEAVIVVLTNHYVDDGQLAYSHGLARPLVDALRSR